MLGGCPTQAANCQSDCSHQAPVVIERALSQDFPKMQVECLTVTTAAQATALAARARSLHTVQIFFMGRLHCLVAMMQLTVHCMCNLDRECPLMLGGQQCSLLYRDGIVCSKACRHLVIGLKAKHEQQVCIQAYAKLLLYL